MSDMLIFVIEPIKTIVKMQFCPLRITPSPPIRYISNGKFAPKFDLVLTFHWCSYWPNVDNHFRERSNTRVKFWKTLQSSCCDDTNFGKKNESIYGSHKICSKYYIGIDYEDRIDTKRKPIADKTFYQKQEQTKIFKWHIYLPEKKTVG